MSTMNLKYFVLRFMKQRCYTNNEKSFGTAEKYLFSEQYQEITPHQLASLKSDFSVEQMFYM